MPHQEAACCTVLGYRHPKPPYIAPAYRPLLVKREELESIAVTSDSKAQLVHLLGEIREIDLATIIAAWLQFMNMKNFALAKCLQRRKGGLLAAMAMRTLPHRLDEVSVERNLLEVPGQCSSERFADHIGYELLCDQRVTWNASGGLGRAMDTRHALSIAELRFDCSPQSWRLAPLGLHREARPAAP